MNRSELEKAIEVFEKAKLVEKRLVELSDLSYAEDSLAHIEREGAVAALTNTRLQLLWQLKQQNIDITV